MPTRSTATQVTFKRPFRLAEIDEELPPGTYDIETEEEVIEGNERTVYIRKATLFRVQTPGKSRTVTIDPAGLDAALRNDTSESE